MTAVLLYLVFRLCFIILIGLPIATSDTSSEPTDSADTKSSEKDAVVEIGVVEKHEENGRT
ncbi:hypothetical protein DENSPDRAFT_840079 [Dentipellis sp. KUC8613]|nr:hypothetical protein DENSPDRAFT_840079 [Dentipellis sp. KUC8613]